MVDPTSREVGDPQGTKEGTEYNNILSYLLKVDEQGAEAAAATAVLTARIVCGVMGPPPVPVIFDHPSIVAITDKAGVPLFLGRVSNPENK